MSMQHPGVGMFPDTRGPPFLLGCQNPRCLFLGVKYVKMSALLVSAVLRALKKGQAGTPHLGAMRSHLALFCNRTSETAQTLSGNRPLSSGHVPAHS
jgi:hypothetical protein